MPFWLKEPNCIKTEAYNVSHMIIRSTGNPLIDIFLYSHHLYGLYCIDIVRRNYVLLTSGSYRVNKVNDLFLRNMNIINNHMLSAGDQSFVLRVNTSYLP